MPPLWQIAKNTSLVLVNTHPTLNRPRPQVPAVIDVGGMHIGKPEKLPEDIQQYLDNSKNGVIVFSMGSVLLTHTFPEEKRIIFMDTFKQISQNVIWKWENSSLPGQPENVKTFSWLPQRDILAHPNVVAFISHGGLLGTSEAVFCGVPILGIPMYGDQHTNVRAVEASGAAIYLAYNKLTKESFYNALTSLISDKKYRENARRLSELYRDRLLPPLETAIYWTEHILKFGGGDHLRVAAVNMPWYQYLLLDILIGVLVSLVVVLYCVYKMAHKLTACIISYSVSYKIDENKKKI
ncbi:UDP-glycosyltransferase UGT5-like isoform X2 [Lycorma delicatula]